MNMRLVVQRVSEASVEIEGEINGQIKQGFMVLVGITNDDNEEIVDKMVNKLINLRIFEDENEKMNLSVTDVEGELLVVSQFTLCGDCKKGTRPSFDKAASPDVAVKLYNYFTEYLKNIDISKSSKAIADDLYKAVLRKYENVLNDDVTIIVTKIKKVKLTLDI